MPSTLDTILFDLDGTLIPMDQDVFLHAYFSRIQQRAVQLGLDPAAFMGALAKGTKAMLETTAPSPFNSGFGTPLPRIWALQPVSWKTP